MVESHFSVVIHGWLPNIPKSTRCFYIPVKKYGNEKLSTNTKIQAFFPIFYASKIATMELDMKKRKAPKVS